MADREHCILVALEAPVDQSSGFTAASLEAYKESLHRYVWQALAPFSVKGGFHVHAERTVFEVDDPAGGEHATDVVFGGLDPGLFCRLLAHWRALPLRAALAAASYVPPDVPGYLPAEVERAWADGSDVDLAFSPGSLAARTAGFEAENDLRAPAWAREATMARKLAQGYYDFEAGFFSLAHGSSKVTREQVDAVEARPEAYALVFVPVRGPASAPPARDGRRRAAAPAPQGRG